MVFSSEIRSKCQIMMNTDQCQEAEAVVIYQIREKKLLDRFWIESHQNHQRVDLLQKCFRLLLKKDVSQIHVKAVSSFSDSFIIIFPTEELLKFVDLIPFQPEYEPVSAQKFYLKQENEALNQESGAEFLKSIRVNEIFSKQDQAFQRFDQLDPKQRSSCKLFSFESFQTGQRKFSILDRQSFHDSYLYHTSITTQKHVYEIIRESFPCRLYFDLEFSKIANPTVNGDILTERFILLVLWKLYDWFQLCLDWNHVIVLDSTTATKFSKHIIIHMKRNQHSHDTNPLSIMTIEYLLPNNIVIQDLLHSIILDMTEEVAIDSSTLTYSLSHNDYSSEVTDISNLRREVSTSSPTSVNENKETIVLKHHNHQLHCRPKPEFQEFWLFTEENQLQFFVDLGVYSRNRAFRLFDSSKYGKQQAFRLLLPDKQRYGFTYTERLPLQMKIELLDASYIIPFDLLLPEPLFPVYEDTNQEPKSSHQSEYLGFDAFLPYLNYHKYRIISFPSTLSSNLYHDSSLNSLLSYQRIHSQSSPNHLQSFRCSSWKNQALVKSKYPRDPSPFPQLDQYLSQTIAQKGGVQGILQEWMIFQKANGDFPIYKIRYQVSRNRFCANIGRAHKSNGIYYEVNLMNHELYQMCWDPDCRGFQSLVMIIPDTTLPHPSEIESTLKQYLQNYSN